VGGTPRPRDREGVGGDGKWGAERPGGALENVALRQQLAVYKRTVSRPRLRTTDRLLWAGLARNLGWLEATPRDRDPRHRPELAARRFREHWTRLSGRPTGGRPPLNAEINVLG